MFGFLSRLMRRRKLVPPPPAPVDPPDEFEYDAGGGRTGWADPLKAYTTLEAECPRYAELLRLLADDPQAIPAGPLREQLVTSQRAATQELLRAVRLAFGVEERRRDEAGRATGLTWSQTMNVLAQFLQWVEAATEDALPKSSLPGAASPPAS